MKENAPKLTPVYIRSVEHAWEPAIQVLTDHGRAKIMRPKFKNQQDMLRCQPEGKHQKYHEYEFVNLKDYDNEVLPMQNVDAHGNLEDYKDMVNLPFMHEVSGSPFRCPPGPAANAFHSL